MASSAKATSVGRQVQRISTLSSRRITKKFLKDREPVVFEGLFSCDQISKIRNIGDLQKAFGRMPVTIQTEYFTLFRRTGDFFSSDAHRSTLGDYVHFLRENPDTRLVLTEHMSPASLVSLLHVPEFCRYRYGLDGSLDSIVSEFFLAGGGNVAHLHFDWDHRHVLLYQVFGTKRLVLFSPEKSLLLNPVFNTSLLSLEALPKDLQNRLINALDGYEAILRPGDAVYIPPLMWHYLEYHDSAMSVSFRFGRTKHGRIFHEFIHPNCYLQNFAWATLHDEQLNGKAKQMYARLLQHIVNSASGGIELYSQIEATCRKAYQESCSTALPEPCWFPLTAFVNSQAKRGVQCGSLYPQRDLSSIASKHASLKPSSSHS